MLAVESMPLNNKYFVYIFFWDQTDFYDVQNDYTNIPTLKIFKYKIKLIKYA